MPASLVRVTSLMMCGALLSLPAANAQYSDDSITLYNFNGFNGREVRFFRENHDLRDSSFDNRTKSIAIGDKDWLVCQEYAFVGPCLVVRQNIDDLSDFGMTNSISSVHPLPFDLNFRHGTVFNLNFSGEPVFYDSDFFGNLVLSNSYSNKHNNQNDNSNPYEGPRNPNLILFAEPNFEGKSIGTTRDLSSLKFYKFDNQPSSIEVVRGEWEVCTDVDYSGNCEVLTHDESQLRSRSMNNNISSVREVPIGTARKREEDWQRKLKEAGLIVYEHGDFKGRSHPIDISIPNLKSIRMNDNISSIELRFGTWSLCSNQNYMGNCHEISVSQSRLNALGLNDNISSIRKIEDKAN